MQKIKLAIRSLLRDKTFSIINIVGLTIALMMSVVILLFVHYHYSFDKNVTNPERSYRIVTGHSAGALWASTFAAFDKALHDHPSIKTSTTFYKNDDEFDLVSGKQKLRIINPIYADTNFMSYFHIPLKIGNPKDIDKPNSVFISEKVAYALFGENNPIGQSILLEYNEINLNENRTATVVGILSDDIMNMHIKFDLIHSKKGFYEGPISQLEQTKAFGAYVYLTLLPGTSATELETQLTNLITPLIGDAFGPHYRLLLQSCKH